MGIEIHQKCAIRLLEVLTEAISQLGVRHGMFTDRWPARTAFKEAERVLPDKGPLREQLAAFIDPDDALTEFVLDSLDQDLRHLPYDEANSPKPLASYEGFGDSQAVAQRLIERLKSLPLSYTVSIKLPQAVSPMMGDRTCVVLSPRIRIVTANSELEETYPSEASGPYMSKLSGLFAAVAPQGHWQEGGLYLQVDAIGFIGIYGGSSPHYEALRTIRAFCGLGIAHRLFEMKPDSSAVPPDHLFVHVRDSNGAFNFQCKLNLDESVSRAINALCLDTLNGWIGADPKRQLIVADDAFNAMRTVFADEKKAESIILASQWFFDGYGHSQDQLLKFIQTMVVLEILLGHKGSSDKTGLSVLLGNRCAYLIGTSQEQRTEVLNLFEEVYDVRSHIVHSGKHRFSRRERTLFHRLRWMCSRAICREIELLTADKNQTVSG